MVEPERTPADIGLAREGGEILPSAPAPENGTKTFTIPEVSEDTHEEIAREVGVFNACLMAVTALIAHRLNAEPANCIDTPGIGPGQRSPLENAEPEIALEIYRKIRERNRCSTHQT